MVGLAIELTQKAHVEWNPARLWNGVVDAERRPPHCVNTITQYIRDDHGACVCVKLHKLFYNK